MPQANITIVAQSVHENEPCLLLIEIEKLNSSVPSVMHRYQILKVVRNDKIATYTEDLGDAKLFPGHMFQIPGGDARSGNIWDTVGRLRGLAAEMRIRTPVEAKALFEEAGHEIIEGSPEKWQEEYLLEADKRKMATSRKGVSGKHFTKMR